jgi:hypothetical protein
MEHDTGGIALRKMGIHSTTWEERCPRAANFIQMGNAQGDAMVDLNNSDEDVCEISAGGSSHGSLVTKSTKTQPSMDRL